MNVWRLVLREISHRKLNFVMGLVSVAVAVACFVGAKTLLRADEIQTQQAGKQLEDSMRKITKGLGFNILILPEDQDVNELLTEGTLSKSMPGEYADRLANSDIVTINHLLPMVVRKVKMREIEEIPLEKDELDRSMFVIGTKGEVPLAHRDPKKPLLDHVPPGTMVVGFQVAKKLELKPSKPQKGNKEKGGKGKSDGKKKPLPVLKTVQFQGREFKVTKAKAELGNRDDSSIWINLGEAQELFDSKNLVNGILALECNCATEDRVAEIRADLRKILPGTQVIESGPPALARAEARNKAKQVAVTNLKQHQTFAGVLVPLVILGCGAWIGLLAFANVRQRASEIGILRAIGLRGIQILLIFLGKAIVIGLIGAVIGYAGGLAFGIKMGGLPSFDEAWSELFTPGLLIASLCIAPAIAALASWIPAVMASRQDPAVILQTD
jgi:hypothetical protein